jgi:hypothetical protein
MIYPHESSPYQGSLARPFVIIGGRTALVGRDLDIATLVFTTDEGLGEIPDLVNEDRAIAVLCTTVHAIAEVAAYMALPLGVVQLLVGDLAQRGMVSLQPPHPSDNRDRELLKKVLSGLQEL